MTEASTIEYGTGNFAAAECKRCGAKFYPPEQLEAHNARHAERDRARAKAVQELRAKFRSMRELSF